MNRIREWKGCKEQLHRPIAPLSMLVAVLAAGLQLTVSSVVSPAFAAFELPAGEVITNLPAIPRNIPQKEAYEKYDPVIGKNFDLKNFWLRADLRVRPEMRNGMCFGNGAPVAGSCNTLANAQAGTRGGGASAAALTQTGNTFYVQQWVRLGIGYDLSPDVNFYMEIIDSATWGANGNPGNANDPSALNNNCASTTSANGAGGCTLGVRAAYVLVRNLGGVQGLSMKAGRQYVIFGGHSLFGHFDWSNTGFSHDGVMMQYSTKNVDSYLGWFREADTNCAPGTPGGTGTCGASIPNNGGTKASSAADLFIF
ncbi:MAG: hypothetical protein HY281_10640, partial [Nitrospirae bacterium]|nr:hypothetical protein [Nitrospirota bacterium]